MKKYLIGAFSGFILGILGNLIASWIQKDLLNDTFNPVSITIIVVFTITGLATAVILDNTKSSTSSTIKKSDSLLYWILTSVICCAVIGFGLLVVISGKFQSKPLTVYFVIDATEKMQPIFDGVRAQVKIASSGLDDSARIGLRVFGGGLNGAGNCQDSQQLVTASSFEGGKDLLDSSLNGVIPQGHSSMTGAILQTLLFDLENESSRSVRLILITSGIDPVCDPPSGDLISNVIKKQNVELIIISIGQQNEQSIKVFESYADAFQGDYLSLPNTESLSPIVGQISMYGYGYGYGNPNITPQP